MGQLEIWQEGWLPFDPDRVCWTCGSPPSHRFPDGSPAYSCHLTRTLPDGRKLHGSPIPHVPVVAPEERQQLWRERAAWTYALTADELAYVREHAKKVVKGWRIPGRQIGSRLDQAIGAYAGEIVVARLLGFPDWLPVYFPEGAPDNGDGPHGHGVRWVAEWRKHLLVYENDPPDRRIVSTVGDPREELMARGWILARDGMEPQWRSRWTRERFDRRGRVIAYKGFYVPTGRLRPMELL